MLCYFCPLVLGDSHFFCPSPDPSPSPPSWHLADPGSYSRNWKPSTTGAQEVIMISLDPRPSPGLARWAESYEAKCERRQETRESRRCRPNVTTCRQVGKALRTQQREQLQRARQQEFFRRRNLQVEEKGKTQSPRAKEHGPSRRPGQPTDLKEPLSWASRISSSPRQQVGHVKGHTALDGGRHVGGLKVTKKRLKLSSFFPNHIAVRLSHLLIRRLLLFGSLFA